MAKKIVGLTCGMKHGNSEDLLKAALILVDQIQVDHCADPGAALTPDNQWAVDRCKQLGRNVAQAMNLPIEQVKYLGEDTAVSCPVCHCNILYIEKDFPSIACPTCQVHGVISFVNGKYQVEWKPEDIKNPRFSTVAEHHHLEWLMRHSKEEESQLALPETQEKIKLYNDYGTFIHKK